MGIFGNLAQARTGYLVGQQEGQARAQAATEAERQRVRQDEQDLARRQMEAMQRALQEAQLRREQMRPTPEQEQQQAAAERAEVERLTRERETHRTNEQIRQWKATQGTVPRNQIGGVPASGGGERQPAPPKPVQASEGERRAAALLQMAEHAAPVILSAEPPGRIGTMVAKLGMNEGLSGELQSQRQAANQLVSSYLYLISGATATEVEVDRQAALLVPQPGDKPDVLARKRQAVETMLGAMRTVAGRAMPQTGIEQEARGRPIVDAPPVPPSQEGDVRLGGGQAGPSASEAQEVARAAAMLAAGQGTIRQLREAYRDRPDLFRAIMQERQRIGAQRDR
jgi:hypothetical protein